MTDIDNQLQLILVPVSLQMFLRPIAKTDKRVAVWRQNFYQGCHPLSGVLPQKQTGINTIMFLPISELSSSWLMTSHSSLWKTHFWQYGGWSKPLILSSHTPTGMAEWREYMYMMQNRAHRLISSQSLKVTLMPPGVMPSTPSLPLSTVGVAIVTFDLPIWLKAMDIIKQANLNVIARLGGFHQLKSYLGLTGNIMQDSGPLGDPVDLSWKYDSQPQQGNPCSPPDQCSYLSVHHETCLHWSWGVVWWYEGLHGESGW